MTSTATFDITKLGITFSPGETYSINYTEGFVTEVGNNRSPSPASTVSWAFPIVNTSTFVSMTPSTGFEGWPYVGPVNVSGATFQPFRDDNTWGPSIKIAYTTGTTLIRNSIQSIEVFDATSSTRIFNIPSTAFGLTQPQYSATLEGSDLYISLARFAYHNKSFYITIPDGWMSNLYGIPEVAGVSNTTTIAFKTIMVNNLEDLSYQMNTSTNIFSNISIPNVGNSIFTMTSVISVTNGLIALGTGTASTSTLSMSGTWTAINSNFFPNIVYYPSPNSDSGMFNYKQYNGRAQELVADETYTLTGIPNTTWSSSSLVTTATVGSLTLTIPSEYRNRYSVIDLLIVGPGGRGGSVGAVNSAAGYALAGGGGGSGGIMEIFDIPVPLNTSTIRRFVGSGGGGLTSTSSVYISDLYSYTVFGGENGQNGDSVISGIAGRGGNSGSPISYLGAAPPPLTAGARARGGGGAGIFADGSGNVGGAGGYASSINTSTLFGGGGGGGGIAGFGSAYGQGGVGGLGGGNGGSLFTTSTSAQADGQGGQFQGGGGGGAGFWAASAGSFRSGIVGGGRAGHVSVRFRRL
jgi:hypothetical protein